MLKRVRAVADDSVVAATPRKRARFDPSIHSSPSHARLIMNTSPFPLVPASTPYTTYTFQTPSSHSHAHKYSKFSPPSDSPSNPFGALQALSLPCPLPFGKHLALRFQLVCRGEDADDVFRIAQVPTNYSFRILHKLILFLFASDARMKAPVPGRIAIPHRRSERKHRPPVHLALAPPVLVGGPRQSGKGKKAAQPVWQGHSFDVLQGIAPYCGGYKRGLIRQGEGSGVLYARLSALRERQLFAELQEECAGSGDEEDIFGGGETPVDVGRVADKNRKKGKGKEVDKGKKKSENGKENNNKTKVEEEEEEDDGWMWEAEDDYTIGHVWRTGPDARRGIIYHHVPGVSVHITMNTQRLPIRKGVSNRPFVFRTRGSSLGAVRISHVAAPTTLPQYDPEDEEDWEVHTDEARLRRFNRRDTFVHFLAREAEREKPQPAHPIIPSPPSTPTKPNKVLVTPVAAKRIRRPLTPYFRSVGREDTLPPSSPPPTSPQEGPSDSGAVAGPSFRSSIFPHRASYPSIHELSSRSSVSTASSPFPHPTPITLALPTFTPYPTHPLHRRRVERATRRLRRLTRNGLSYMSSSSEEEEDQLKDDDQGDLEAEAEEENQKQLEREQQHEKEEEHRVRKTESSITRSRISQAKKIQKENSPELDLAPSRPRVKNSPELDFGSSLYVEESEEDEEDQLFEDQYALPGEEWDLFAEDVID
ncbi:hypothetical protein BKA93DRAFT_193733 [Sparassis latifolia]